VVDLRRLMRQTETGAMAATVAPPPARRARWLVPAMAMAIAGISGGVYAIVRLRGEPDPKPAIASIHRTSDPGPSSRKLNSTPIRGRSDAVISPDGTKIAMLRDDRLTIQDVRDENSRDLSPSIGRIVWFDWFPDGKHLLLGMATSSPHAALYQLDLVDGSTHELGTSSWGASVSHDGARLASFDEGGLRTSNLDGSHDRLLVGTREEAEFSWPAWSPDDRWIVYSIRGPDIVPALRAVASDGSTDVLLVEDPALASPSSLPDYEWLHDGRLLYRTSNELGSSLSVLDIDPVSAHPRGHPIQIATFSDFVALHRSSNDGALLYSIRTATSQTMKAPLAAKTLDPKPAGQRGGHFIGRSDDRATTYYAAATGVDRTELLAIDAGDHVRVLASFSGSPITPELTADARTIVYLYVDLKSRKVSLRSVPTSGGDPRVVEELPYEPTVPPDFTGQLVAQIACARRSSRCILGAMEAGEQVFYELDAEHGRGKRLAAARGPAPWLWDLSPDGKSLLIANQREKNVVRVLEIDTGRTNIAFAHPDTVAFGLAWLDDSRSFIVALTQIETQQLVRVDARGRQSVLWTGADQLLRQIRVLDDPEPTLYFEISSFSKNYWLLTIPPPAAMPP
jgi:hypothetical protein